MERWLLRDANCRNSGVARELGHPEVETWPVLTQSLHLFAVSDSWSGAACPRPTFVKGGARRF